MQNIAPESHDFSSVSRKLNAKVLILLLFFFFLSFPSSITQKVYSIHEQSTHQTNALLSEIFLFLVRAACMLRSTSYGPNMRCNCFSVHHFVGNYTHNSITQGGIRTFYLSNDCSNIENIYSLEIPRVK